MKTRRVRSSPLLRFTLVATVRVGVAAAGIFTAGGLSRASAQTPEVAASLRLRVDAYETAWNTHDPSALSAFFTDDADMIMGNRPTTAGREAIQEWWRAYFAVIEPERRGTFAVSSMRSVTPDVAVINVATTTGGSDAQGNELPTRLARGTWVVVREDGEWFISALRGQPAEGDVR